MKNILKKGFYIFFPLVIGGIVSIIIKNHLDYSILNKPPLSPPKLLFPIAWSIIYLLMGISYYLFRKDYLNNEDKITFLYYFQLFINALWSIIFFLFKWRFLAIIWILLLLALIVWLTMLLYQKVKISSYLYIPYIIWVIFATYLTIGIYILN